MDDKIKFALLGDAIGRFERVQKGEPFSILYPSDIDDAIAALRARSEDNPPLTLEELRGMDCEPVWVDEISKPNESRETRSKGYVLARWGYVQMVDDSGLLAYQLQFFDYEKTWLAYRRKPEGSGA